MEWCESYRPNYFSIEDILATQERIPCVFKQHIYGLGYLDPSTGSEDLLSGTKLELPCWLTVPLGTAEKPIVSAQLPSTFREKNREIIKADPTVVDLHRLGPYFYEVGQHLLPIAGNEAPQITRLLTQTLRERLRKIMDSALHSLADETSSQMANLDELERSLYKVGQASLRDYELWLTRKSHIVASSSLIEKTSKRKFSEIC